MLRKRTGESWDAQKRCSARSLFSFLIKIHLLLQPLRRTSPQPKPLQAKVFFIHFILCCLNLLSASLFLFAFCRLWMRLSTGSRMVIFFLLFASQSFIRWLVASSMMAPMRSSMRSPFTVTTTSQGSARTLEKKNLRKFFSNANFEDFFLPFSSIRLSFFHRWTYSPLFVREIREGATISRESLRNRRKKNFHSPWIFQSNHCRHPF